MAKLSIAACAALFLLSAIVASPLNRKHSTTVAKHLYPNLTMEEIIIKLKEVKKVRMWTLHLNIIVVVINIIH